MSDDASAIANAAKLYEAMRARLGIVRPRLNAPLTLADRQFAHGVYMDAPAAVMVRLPQPASAVTAQVGIDNNRDTQAAPTTSSARFHVTVADKRAFSSPVRTLRDGALAVRVPLAGARDAP